MATVYKTQRELDDEDHEKYKKKQAEMLERRRAKREAEGFKCTKEGCGESFNEYFDLQSHIYEHQVENRKNMVCNKDKCRQKFNNRRDYNEHNEMHKEEDKVKISSNIRSVLLYNKNGLLMEEFEREFKSMMGKAVPYTMFGYNCCYDLVINLPDVVQVTQLNGGQTLLLAVPDKSTEHIAKMIGNQRTNRDGFNYRTGEVLASVGRDVLRKIGKIADQTNRVVPDFMKKQVEQLVGMDVIEEGLNLHEFIEIYDQEFGYPLEFRCYGFYSPEDFVFHGLAGVVEIELDGFRWKIVPSGYNRPSGDTSVKEIPFEVKHNMKKLLEENPFGMSVPTVLTTYEGCFGQLNLRQLRCKDAVELFCLIPEICVVDKSDLGDCTILPAGYQVVKEKVNGKKSFPLWVMGEVKNNIWKVLKSLSSEVALTAFVKGYEGYYGYLNLADLQCKDMMELCRLMPDVCSLQLSQSGQYAIGPVNKSVVGNDANRSIKNIQVTKLSAVPANVVKNVKRVLIKNPGGVNQTKFYEKYLETVGENIDGRKFGFPSLKSLLSSLDGSFVKFETSGQELIIKMVTVTRPSPGINLSREYLVQASWVNVVKVVSPDLVYLQVDSMMDKLWTMEEEMEKFYTQQRAGQELLPELVVVGQLVAAVYKDTAWHRGRVVAVKDETRDAEIFYVDHGWTARVKIVTLRCLDSKFSSLPEQAVAVKLSGLKSVGGGRQWSSEVVRGLKGIVGEGKGRGWIQIREGDNVVDLFINLAGKSGPGKMISVNQALVEQGLAVAAGGQKVGVMDRKLMWGEVTVPVVTKSIKSNIALQRLVLTSLVRVRRD